MTRLLEVRDLRKTYPVHRGLLQRVTGETVALDGVSFHLDRGECLAVVGESGGGKTTLARCILRLIEACEGEILFDGVDLRSLAESDLRKRRRDLQMVFQDPYSSLNPRMSVKQILSEPLEIHAVVPPAERRQRVVELLQVVGLPAESANRYPHEFSGGQRQRIGIARALAPQPRFLVADEPVSALDVSVRAEILNLLSDQRRRLGLAVLLIAHDLTVVEQTADRVAVLFLGRIVEMAATNRLFGAAQHPYTVALMASAPVADPTRRRNRITLSGELPSPAEPPPGCKFHPRCPIAQERCLYEEPSLTEIAPGHDVACHYPGELSFQPVDREENGTF